MLAAVVFLDVVNFTVMMAADEARTYDRWSALRDGLIAQAICDHDGIHVKSTGDGLLARFSSALDAVEWADRVQQALHTAQEDGPVDEPRIEVRISIHIGDVIFSNQDVFGDCVNFAARLLEHAEPGCVIMSDAVYELVKTSAGARARDIGFVQLKSYEQLARLYELPPIVSVTKRRLSHVTAIPSIAVLPLATALIDDADVYLADGIIEDVIVSLSALDDLLVVSRASTLRFRGFGTDPREVGRTLRVRYVLMGTLRTTSRGIKLSWQLCSTDDGVALWSETMEVEKGELFETQDRIVTKIVAGLAPKVRAVELRRAMRKRPESFTAYEFMLRGLHLLNGLDPQNQLQAYRCLEEAMRDDPFFASPFAWAAWWQILAVGQGLASDPAAAVETAGSLAARSIELDGTNAMALSVYGHVKSYLFHQYEIGLQYIERALQAGPSSAQAWTFSAASLSYVGQGEQAVAHATHAIRLSPLDRNIFFLHSNLCLAHYSNGNYVEAVRWARLCESENPRFSSGYRLLAASLVATGDLDQARMASSRMLQLEPRFNLTEYTRTRQPFRDQNAAALFVTRLRAAGLPD